ncbi:glucosyl transferase [Rahnella sp. PAMC25617]|uniref:glucosyl transferase n=1 Tax=Rahnella sp. PAMC25617 TaxID=3399684 RepID=UPI003D36852E
MYKVIISRRTLLWILLFLLVFIAITARRPDIILHAQPWAEDGRAFFQGVYNRGFISYLISPQDGYYQTLPKLAFGIGLLFGVSKAALVATIIAISLRCAFVMFVLSQRFNFIKLQYRIVFCIYFILMPNAIEGYVNITNAHFYLSFYLLTIILARPPTSLPDKIHDLSILILSGLSGPFIIFLAPSLFIKRYSEHGGIMNAIKKINSFDVIFTCCVLIQASCIIFGGVDRPHTPLGASLGLLADIISYKVLFGTFFDLNSVQWVIDTKIANKTIFVFLVATLCYFTIKSGWRFKAFIVFPVIALALALAKPIITLTGVQWPLFFIPIAGGRYFFITGMAVFCFTIFLIDQNFKKPTIALIIMMILLAPGFYRSFKMPPLIDVGYNEGINKLQNALPGEKVIINTNPPGWSMELIKK